MNRRNFLTSSLATGALAVAPSLTQAATPAPTARKLGITMASYMQRWRKRGTPESGNPPWNDALDVLDHCQVLGAGCLQIGVAKWTEGFAGKVRDKRESLGIHLEGQVRLPWKEKDTERFESDIRAAKETGASVLRAVCLSGRRYEKFETLEEWRKFEADSKAALERAEPILARHKMKLGFENHKDWRADEQLALLRHLDSEHIGVTFDFGNNIALLEDPYEFAEAVAPYIFTTHMKDMGMAEYEDGFLLSEVPMGTGILDLKRLMQICRKHNPYVWFNLEMITRDPLEVPVLTDKFWVTMDSITAPSLAGTLALAKPGKVGNLPRISDKDWPGQMALEERLIRESFAYAQAELGFA